MRYAQVKKQADINLIGVECTADFCDNSLKMLTIKDAAGNVLRVRMDSYSVVAEVPAPPPMKTVHRLHGTVAGIAVSHDFDTASEARNVRDEYLNSLRDPDTHAALNIEPVEVLAE